MLVPPMSRGGHETCRRPSSTQHLLLERLADRPAARDEHPAAQALTTREAEILELMAGGFANREIARALHLAEGTVKNHVSSILLKLGVRDRTRAVLRGLVLGLFRGGAR